MVRIKMNIKPGKKAEFVLIDDSEVTPGLSEQYTRFTQNKANFEQAWNNTVSYSEDLAAKTLGHCLYSCGFKIVDIDPETRTITLDVVKDE